MRHAIRDRGAMVALAGIRGRTQLLHGGNTDPFSGRIPGVC